MSPRGARGRPSGRFRRPLAAAAFALLAGAAGGWWARSPALPPAARGRQLAERLGCFNCHGPGGTGGVANAGGEEPEVPGWTAGTPLMFVRTEAEWNEWVLDGMPRRLREAGDRPTGVLRMPAYRGFVSGPQLADLVAYLKAVAGTERPPAGPAARGVAAAVRLGCVGCHGPGGRTGGRNPRSLTGTIPAWVGPDFASLVHDDAELRDWILDGGTARLGRDPLARFFLARQRLAMPGFRDVLRPGELEELVAYIGWLRAAH